MSRKFALLAAACAFTAILGAGSVAHAQAQSDMIPPGAPLPGGSTTRSSTQSFGTAPPGNSRFGGSASPTAAAAPARPMAARPMARSGRPMAGRPGMRSGTRAAAANPNGAYMGGGGVYERQADGSLRPVM